MGAIYCDPETDSFEELPETVKDAVDHTLRAVGVNRWGNAVVKGFRDDGITAIVKVQIGSGQEMDLSDRTVLNRSRSPQVWHQAGMLTLGRIERVHEYGYVTLAVQGRY